MRRSCLRKPDSVDVDDTRQAGARLYCLLQRRSEARGIVRFVESELQSCGSDIVLLLLLLLPNPFRGTRAWRKTMEPQKPGNSPGPGPEVVEKQRVAKE